jgi:hypothetical protein
MGIFTTNNSVYSK